MPKSPPSEPTQALLEALSRAIRQLVTIREASEQLGYESPKQLYNRLSGHTPLSFDELLQIVDHFGFDLRQLLIEAKLDRPSLVDVAALLRYYAKKDAPQDERLLRFFAAPPPCESHGRGTETPARFLELDELRSQKPESFTEALRSWLEETYFQASLEPTPDAVVRYCSALDLSATDLAHRGQHDEAAVVLAEALELLPTGAGLEVYLRENCARTLMRLGQPGVGYLVAKTAFATAALGADQFLEARCLLTVAAIDIMLDEHDSLKRAETAYRRVGDLVPDGRYAVASAINGARIAVGRNRPEDALATLDRIVESKTLTPTYKFYELWIRGRAHKKLGNSSRAQMYFLASLQAEPEVQDPVNLVLVFDGLRQLQGISRELLQATASQILPFVQRISTKSPAAATLATDFLLAYQSREAPASDADALMERFKSLLSTAGVDHRSELG